MAKEREGESECVCVCERDGQREAGGAVATEIQSIVEMLRARRRFCRRPL